MTTPQPLHHYKELLLHSDFVKELIQSEYEDDAQDAIDRFNAGDDDELWDLLEDHKYDRWSPEETIEAAGPDYDIFEIEIFALGPVFFIRANEFDEIGYFDSVSDAISYAKSEYEEWINALDEREYCDDEEEDEDEEE
ncbi:MAG: hypothetical protein ACOVRB_08850 [Akkermansiaceae bacterium]